VEFHIKREVLLEELSRAASVVEDKNSIPILNNVLVRSMGHKLKIVGTNLETTVQTVALAEQVIEEGEICVNASGFVKMIQAMPQQSIIHIESQANFHITIAARKTKYRMPGSDPSSYPPCEIPANLSWIELPGDQLKSLITGVRFAVAPDTESRFLLKGALLEVNGDNMVFSLVATDGHRLSLAAAPLTSLVMEDLRVVIPMKGLIELSRTLKDHKGDIEVGKDPGERQLYFRAGERLLSTRLLVGEFPNYERIFAANVHEHFGTFDASELAASIKRTLLVADPHSYSVSLSFTPGALSLSAQTAETGDINEGLESNFNGEDLKIYVNGSYLQDFLDPLGSTPVQLQLKTPEDALHFIAETLEGVRFRYIALPMDVPA
jgi:DNA polymerase-3 subunit beta